MEALGIGLIPQGEELEIKLLVLSESLDINPQFLLQMSSTDNQPITEHQLKQFIQETVSPRMKLQFISELGRRYSKRSSDPGVGDIRKPVAFPSKFLDPVIRGWPTCVQVVAATAILVEETRKLTFGTKIRVHTPHAVRTILTQRSGRWMTDSRILKYETILMERDDLTLTINSCVDPSHFLYGQKEIGYQVEHNCLDIINYQTKVREDLLDNPIEGGIHLFTDGSLRVVEGKRRSSYAVVDKEGFTVVESGVLPSDWSAQACEIYTVISALWIVGEGIGTIYTDSRYAWGVVHVRIQEEALQKDIFLLWSETGSLVHGKGHWKIYTSDEYNNFHQLLVFNLPGEDVVEGKTEWASVTSTKKILYPAAGCKPIGMGSGGTCHTGPLITIIVLQLVIITVESSCLKCYHNVYYKEGVILAFREQKYVNKAWYDKDEQGIYVEGDKQYWMATNLGLTGTRLGSDCPEGEEWICWDALSKGKDQDLIKKEIVTSDKQKVQQNKTSLSLLNNLYLDLKQKLTKYLEFPLFPVGPGSDGPMSGLGGMDSHHMNGSLGNNSKCYEHCELTMSSAIFYY
ncbi:hypothetical protein BTVI_39508 [Pitangus sulphuratus]|nr:hypothetical protein BTVI_39508 [Pitangus sulphuratus]